MAEYGNDNPPPKAPEAVAASREIPRPNLGVTELMPVQSPLQTQEQLQHLDSGAKSPDRMKKTTTQLRLESPDSSLPKITPEMLTTLNVLANIEHTLTPEQLTDPLIVEAFDRLYPLYRADIDIGSEMDKTRLAARMAVKAAVREAKLQTDLRAAKGYKAEQEDSMDIAQNPWKSVLEGQGIRFDIPDFFAMGGDLPPEITPQAIRDKLTNMYVENDPVRLQLIKNIRESTKNGDDSAILSADADNLKNANTVVDKKFGNMLIREGASTITQVLAGLQLPEGAKVVVVRQTGAADETIAWITGVPKVAENDPMHINNIVKVLQERLNQATAPKQVTVEHKGQQVPFAFSTTATVMSTTDERVRPLVQQVISAPEVNGSDDPAAKLYNSMKEITDVEVSTMKISKDLARLPIESLKTAKGLNEVKQRLADEIGNSRISKPLLLATMDIVSGLAWLYGKQNAATDEGFAQEIQEQTGFTLEEISTYTTEEALEAFWQRQLAKKAQVGVQ